MIDLKSYRWFQFEPVDAWFFRDSRPSNRREDQSDLDSEFPPHPATLVGAIRAALARQQGWNGNKSWSDDLKNVLGDGYDNLGQLSFVGPFLMKDKRQFWPLPRHVVRVGNDEWALMQPQEPIISDIGEVRFVSAPKTDPKFKPPAQVDGWYVDTGGMSKILTGIPPTKDQCVQHDTLFKLESRVGILRDKEKRTTDENALYSPRYVRPQREVSLVAGVAGLPEDWGLPSLLPLGGESRMALVNELDRPPELPSGSSKEKYQVVINVTPARFADPWWGAGPSSQAAGLIPEWKGQVVSVALDRPQFIGGWDSIAGAPRPLVPCVPPGTVWWIESEQQYPSSLELIGTASNHGYGFAFVAAYD